MINKKIKLIMNLSLVVIVVKVVKIARHKKNFYMKLIKKIKKYMIMI